MVKKKKAKDNEELNELEQIELNTKRASRDMFLEYAPYLIIIAFVVVIRIFIATPIDVNGSSMVPTLKDNDIMILYKLTKRVRGIKRFDIVVIDTDSGKLIKRVIGLPGEKIKYETKVDEEGNVTSRLLVNGKEVKEDFLPEAYQNATCANEWTICNEEIIVPEDEYFVMGDNRGDSKDSRMIGMIPYDKVLGTTELTIFPFNRFGVKE